jgi:hypothetical protein
MTPHLLVDQDLAHVRGAERHLRLGFVEIQQRRYPEAIASIKRAIDLGVFYPYAAGGLAFAYAASG